jgi:hypothetical protein
MKAALIRLGIRGFNPKLKRAAQRLEDLRTPEDEPIPPNTLAELRRDMERRRLVRDQIRQIEEARLERLEQAPCDGPHAIARAGRSDRAAPLADVDLTIVRPAAAAPPRRSELGGGQQSIAKFRSTDMAVSAVPSARACAYR